MCGWQRRPWTTPCLDGSDVPRRRQHATAPRGRLARRRVRLHTAGRRQATHGPIPRTRVQPGIPGPALTSGASASQTGFSGGSRSPRRKPSEGGSRAPRGNLGQTIRGLSTDSHPSREACSRMVGYQSTKRPIPEMDPGCTIYPDPGSTRVQTATGLPDTPASLKKRGSANIKLGLGGQVCSTPAKQRNLYLDKFSPKPQWHTTFTGSRSAGVLQTRNKETENKASCAGPAHV
jgi:hypothetical protein